ncbi:polyribonucleotide nucleotidyltransferase [Hellea sp.]|nr:polyribonucleotide nucleotidyltransferase [Hellea sp.]MDA8889214.1 polyribonucleotide nucleotidyltransferase [Hellea sp.]MDB4845172.1 polyribonucleotide nucleotidyltransferase [Hellea sp.]MDC0421592.1 polyribonucleotide nucleotidyltransferase [Hellea sp.]MDC0651194.1 polyribonucleotide nucleotidyltransferase [Hellea sp.]MDC1062687.1 polyribonucleotide nucleotidyltransferase [Hellea sp.]
MFNKHTVEIDWAGRPLKLETGGMARQADGAVLATYGETVLLATVCAAKSEKPGQSFFPLTVNYMEKFYAAGKVPGGYFKREGRPTERETLIARLTDRPIRPLFPKGFKNEVQVVITVLQHDLENEPDVLGMIAASAALTISGVPFQGPIAAARIGLIEGDYVLNPTLSELNDSELDLVVAGTSDAVMMVESEAKELTEEQMLGAVMYAHESCQDVIKAIKKLAKSAGKPAWEFKAADLTDAKKSMKKVAEKGIKAAYKLTDKMERQDALRNTRLSAWDELGRSEANPDGMADNIFSDVFKSIESSTVRSTVIKTKKRIDGRKLDEVRPIVSEAGMLPRTHGSALFTRGETQALCVATLGTSDDEQFVDQLTGTIKNKFLLHYNFPPYSVGEAGRMGGTSRREQGHGKLAWRALQAVLPAPDDFPYTIRLVSEIMESNGSSSMATVCGCSLAMMDAGVPLKRPVSGIAMGLIKEDDGIAVLSDILGDEDHLGDMDFKVAGTSEGITSLQMDIKIAGISEEIMTTALEQANAGRLHILGEMNKSLEVSREEVGEFAPRIETVKIPVDKIRDVIGTGGKVIREIVDTTGARVSVEDDGTIKIASTDKKSIEAAKEWIHSLTAEPEAGVIYKGKVVKVVDFGAFVNFFGKKDGLVHVSQILPERVNHPSDHLKEGQEVYVKLMGFDDRGKVRLAMKYVDQETGLEIPREPREDNKDKDKDEEKPKRKRRTKVKKDEE